MNRDTDIEKAMGAMTLALRAIASNNDCDYCMESEGTPRPCTCAKCIAVHTLAVVDNWRHIGARADRVKTSPRERKIMAAWKDVDDNLLSAVLADRDDDMNIIPTTRDWYVAMTVVQWLATNVGMDILRKAGFEYMQYDEDRKEMDKRKVPELSDEKTWSRKIERIFKIERDHAMWRVYGFGRNFGSHGTRQLAEASRDELCAEFVAALKKE